MAKITITFEDDPEEVGKVNISMESNPPYHIHKPEDNSAAQGMSLQFVDWLAKKDEQSKQGEQEDG